MRLPRAKQLSRLRDSFAHRIFTLSAGMVVGQGILILLTPVLTRLYSPEEFGIFAIIGGIVSLFATIVALRLEFAIPLCADDRSARLVSQIGAMSVLMITTMLAFCIFLFGHHFAEALDSPALMPLLWIVPPALVGWGLGSVLNGWALRQGLFRIKSHNLILQYGSQGVSQTGFGLVGLTQIGLVFGLLLGHLIRATHLLIALPSQHRTVLLEQPALIELGRSLKSHWRYPAYVAPSSFCTTAIQLLPVILISALYGPLIAGLYGLTQRVVALPTRLIADAASQAFVFQGTRYQGAQFHRFFKRTSLAFLGMALVILSPLLIAGPQLFAFVFGEEWRQAGSIAQILVPINAARFVFAPISQSLNIVGRQDIHILATTLLILALAGSFFLGWWMSLEPTQTILIYSLSSTFCYGVYFTAAWIQSRRRQPELTTAGSGPPDQ